MHGALLDSYILAKVYLELIGGSQPNLEFNDKQISNSTLLKKNDVTGNDNKFSRTSSLSSRLTEEERKKHKDFITKINGLSKWSLYN